MTLLYLCKYCTSPSLTWRRSVTGVIYWFYVVEQIQNLHSTLTLSLNCVLKVNAPSHPAAHDLCLNTWRITPFTFWDWQFSHFKRNQCTWAPRSATLRSHCLSDLQMSILLPSKAHLYLYTCFALGVWQRVANVTKPQRETECNCLRTVVCVL